MSDAPTPVEQEAHSLGWRPKEQFRGDPEHWVDADTFLERGRTVLPILKENNKKLSDQLSERARENKELKGALDTTRRTVEELVKFQAEEVKRQVDKQLKELRLQHAEAVKEGDTALVADLEEEIDAAKERKAAANKPPSPAPPAPQSQQLTPEQQAFKDENSDWFGVDRRRTAMFVAEASDLDNDPAWNKRGQAVILAEAKKRMEAFFAPGERPTEKLEGGSRGGGGGGGGGGDGGKSFNSLPADAKAVARADAKRFVGQNKAYKTEAEWFSAYAKIYYGQEA